MTAEPDLETRKRRYGGANQPNPSECFDPPMWALKIHQVDQHGGQNTEPQHGQRRWTLNRSLASAVFVSRTLATMR